MSGVAREIIAVVAAPRRAVTAAVVYQRVNGTPRRGSDGRRGPGPALPGPARPGPVTLPGQTVVFWRAY